MVSTIPGAAQEKSLEARLQESLESYRERYGFPGATAAFVLPDKTTVTAAAGVADRETGRPMTPGSRMLAASIGKSFVAALAVSMAREGALDLDAPVSRWLGERPWFSRLPNHETVTVAHLMRHTSGLPNHVHMESFASGVAERWQRPSPPFSREELVEFVLDREPLFAAGGSWAYTDTGYVLLGMVIEEAGGRGCFEEIGRRFLDPLGLEQTSPSDSRVLPGLAAGYMAADNPFGFPEKTTTSRGRMAWHPGLEWTGGGLVSTSRDLARWGFALFGGRAMGGDYLDWILESAPVVDGVGYGAGVGVRESGDFGPVWGHGGWIPGYSSSLRYYPDHKVSVAFQINTDIGIVDDSTDVIREMEAGLAGIAVAAAGSD